MLHLPKKQLMNSGKTKKAMGQNPAHPVNIPIPTKISTNVGGEFTYPKTAPLVLTHSQKANRSLGFHLWGLQHPHAMLEPLFFVSKHNLGPWPRPVMLPVSLAQSHKSRAGSKQKPAARGRGLRGKAAQAVPKVPSVSSVHPGLTGLMESRVVKMGGMQAHDTVTRAFPTQGCLPPYGPLSARPLSKTNKPPRVPTPGMG